MLVSLNKVVDMTLTHIYLCMLVSLREGNALISNNIHSITPNSIGSNGSGLGAERVTLKPI